MKIYKISQNVQYLQSIGVPAESADAVLNYLLSLDKDERKNAIRQIRQNPNIPIEDLKQPINREQYLKTQGIPQEIIEFANSISSKYSDWITREIMKWLKLITNWGKQYQWLKSQKKNSKTLQESNQITDELNHMYIQKDLITGMDYTNLYKNLSEGDKGLYKMMLVKGDWKSIIDWIEQNNPDIMQMSLRDAWQASDQWHEELAKSELDESLKYSSHEVVHSFGDGWEIVKLSPGDCSAEGNRMGHCVEGYWKDVESGRTQIYSLRDPKDEPHVTIEMIIPASPSEKVEAFRTNSLKDNDPNKYKRIAVYQIQGKENKEPIDEYKKYIKEWFNSLKQKGYKFEPIAADEQWDITNFQEVESKEDDYGIPIEIDGIGGNQYTWRENLTEAYNTGKLRDGDINEGIVYEIMDNLISYAIKTEQIDSFGKAVDEFSQWADEQFSDWDLMNSEFMPQYPQEKNFTTYPEENPNQPEFNAEGFEETKKEVFDQEAYNKALEDYNQSLNELAQDYPPTKINSYLRKEWNKAMEKNKLEQTKEQQIAAKSSQRIVTADKKIPDAEDLAAYVEALNIHLENGKIKDKKIESLVKRLPYPDSIRMGFSEQECRILFDSIAYAWKEISGQDLVEESKIEHPPKGLEGNYWMIMNGVILEGPNHFTIIKQNQNMFANLLNISAFVIQEKMASPPDELIKTVIDHGGMRIFIDKKNKGYFQLSDKTYSEWGREKIKGLDLKEKIVKVIDRSTPYRGWSSGVLVKL